MKDSKLLLIIVIAFLGGYIANDLISGHGGSTNKYVSENNSVYYENIYVGNKNSGKFHLPSCDMLPAQKNQVIFKSIEEAINNNYSPCKICNPGK